MLRASMLLSAIAASAALVGCRAPMPSVNPFTPFGSTRVPAPGTNSYGQPGGYYTPNNAPAATTPKTSSTQPAGSSRFQSADNSSASLSESGWHPLGGSRTRSVFASDEPVGTGLKSNNIELASHNQPASDEPTTATPDTASAISASTPALQFNGMHVNDATAVTAPRMLPPTQPVPLLLRQPTHAAAPVVASSPQPYVTTQSAATIAANPQPAAATTTTTSTIAPTKSSSSGGAGLVWRAK